MKYGVVGNRIGWTKEQVFNGLKKIGIDHGDTIVSGGARGVDSFAQEYAKMVGALMVICYPNPNAPIPRRYFARNELIVDNSTTIIAFNKKQKSGTKYTINYASMVGKQVIEYKE